MTIIITVPMPAGAVVGDTDAQTFTNKTINVSSNTLTDTSRATGDILVDTGASYRRLAKGDAYSWPRARARSRRS